MHSQTKLLVPIQLYEKDHTYCCRCRKEVGVIAALFQVHHHVEQRDLVSSSTGVQGFKVTCEDELVVFPGLQKIKNGKYKEK